MFQLVPTKRHQAATRLSLLAGGSSLLHDLLSSPSSRSGSMLRGELLASSSLTPPRDPWALQGGLSHTAEEFKNMGAAAQQALIGVIISTQLKQHRRDNDALVLGGGLNVTVLEAVGLPGGVEGVCSFAKVGVTDPYQTIFNPMATSHGLGKAERWPGLRARVLQEQQTPVMWQSSAPKWDCLLQFRCVVLVHINRDGLPGWMMQGCVCGE